MGNDICIRKFKKDDVHSIEGIYDLYWHDDFRIRLSERLNDFVNQKDDSIKQDFQYFVAEKDGEVVGIASTRKLPDHMKMYSTTNNPVELYVVAVKYQNQGIGKILRNKMIDEARSKNCTEILFFSGEKHKDSWSFHDSSGFERVGDFVAPNGEKGHIWRMAL